MSLVVAARPPEPGAAGDSLATLIAQADEVLELRPLSRAAIGAVVEEALGPPAPEFVTACATVTGGNAFLLAELLRSLADVAPTAHTVARVHAAAPDGVRRRVARELAVGPEEATRVAAALAVLGEAELPVLAALAGMEPAQAMEAARALRGVELVALGERTVRFVHPLIASVIEAGVGAGQVSASHAAAARVLADAGAPIDRVAGHLLAADPGADAWVVATLREAAQAASARGAPEAAVQYLRRALAEPPGEQELPGLLLAAGSAEIQLREFRTAAATLASGLEAQPDPDTATKLGLALSQAHYLGGAYAEAADALEVARLMESDPARRLVLEANLISLDLLDPARRSGAELRMATYRRQEARGTLDEPTLLAMLGATSLLAPEPRERGVALIRRALDRGLTAGGGQTFAYGWAVAALDAADHADLARDVTEARLDISRREGDNALTAYLLVYASHFDYRLGRLAEAEALGREAIDRLENLGDGQMFPFGFLDVLIERGGLDEAEALLERLPRAGAPQAVAMARLMQARVDLAVRGPEAGTLQALEEVGALLDELALGHPQFSPWRFYAAESAHGLGSPRDALRHAQAALDFATRSQTPTAIAHALRVRGVVTGSVDDLRAAVDTLAGTQDGLELAHALTELGSALRDPGTLQDALAAAYDCGALAVADRARRELVAAGARPARSAPRGVDALTPAELQVARHAAAGLSDRAIAETLFVTVRTVEDRLTRAYAKLGVTGREGLALALG